RILVAKTPVNHDNTVIDMTISLGISSYTGHEKQACTRELLIAQADKALYEAKHSGRNKVMLFNPTLS
ncbi:MAG: diguanylate cyclase, partial [Methylovulum sp.]